MTPAAKFSISTSALATSVEEDLLAARLLEVEHHRLLVGVQHDQRIGLDLALAAAHDVALRRLDLEHAGAHEAELQAAIGAVVDLPEIEHEHAVERAADGWWWAVMMRDAPSSSGARCRCGA